MNIIISNADSTPIYEQILRQIKNKIICGEFKSGDMLPSIRSLAKDLRISVITTKRAYDELEKEGYVNTVAGKGCYISEKNIKTIQKENKVQIKNQLKAIIKFAKLNGLNKDDIFEIINEIEEKNYD